MYFSMKYAYQQWDPFKGHATETTTNHTCRKLHLSFHVFFSSCVFVLITLCHCFGRRGYTATVTTLSLIKEVNPPSRYHARGKHDTLGAARWMYDTCLEAGLVSTLNNIRVTAWLWGCWTTHTHTHTHTDTASQSDVSQLGTANMVQTLLSPSSTSWASPIPLVSAWLNGGHISRLHLLWHCMCVCECRQGVSQWLMLPQ